MYEAYFGLSRRPFSAANAVPQFFPAESAEHARLSLVRVIERGEGVGVLMGAAGVGKSVVLRRVAADVAANFDLALLSSGSPSLTRREMLQSILFELSLPFRGLDEGELRLTLLERLLADAATQPAVVLLVDEAHRWPVPLLDELRQLADVLAGGAPRLRVVLAGGGSLEETLAAPVLESLSQRIAARAYLQPWTRSECGEYVRSQVRACGREELFSAGAVENLYRASDGLPRLLSQMADAALDLAAKKQYQDVPPELIEDVWAELQQMPAPWAEPRKKAVSGGDASIIEFGDLSEDLSAEELSAEEVSAESLSPTAAPPGTSALDDDDAPSPAVVEFGELEELPEIAPAPAPAPVATFRPAVPPPPQPVKTLATAKLAPPAPRVSTETPFNVRMESAAAWLASHQPIGRDVVDVPPDEPTPTDSEEVVHDRWSALESSLGRIRPIVRPVKLPVFDHAPRPAPAPIHAPSAPAQAAAEATQVLAPAHVPGPAEFFASTSVQAPEPAPTVAVSVSASAAPSAPAAEEKPPAEIHYASHPFAKLAEEPLDDGDLEDQADFSVDARGGLRLSVAMEHDSHDSESGSESVSVGPQAIVLHPHALAESSGVLGSVPLRAIQEDEHDHHRRPGPQLVVVEDSHPDDRPLNPPPAPARKREFRQMFARLAKGLPLKN